MTVRTVLEISKVSGLLAVTFLCVTLGITALRLGTTVRKANANLDQIHATLVVTDKLVNDSRVTVDNFNHAAIDERFYFEKQMPKVMAQVHNVLDDTHQLLAAATIATQDLNLNQNRISSATVEVLKDTDRSIARIAPTVDEASKVLGATQHTVTDIDSLVTSRDVTGTLHNLNTGTATIDATLTDVQHEVHGLIYPKPVVEIINWSIKIGNAVGSWLHW